jgi:uncharacterized membrane protein
LLALIILFAAAGQHAYAGVIVQSSQSSSTLTYDVFGSIRGMGDMGGVDGDRGSHISVQNQAFPYFEVGIFILIGVAIVGIGISAYLAFSRARANSMTRISPVPKNAFSLVSQRDAQSHETLYPFVLKALTDEERKIVDLLASHDGKYLQKNIRNETGFSRLQTSRIITRLSKRGIVTLQHSGNTNEVSLANWLKQETTSER